MHLVVQFVRAFCSVLRSTSRSRFRLLLVASVAMSAAILALGGEAGADTNSQTFSEPDRV
jgi:hypothetical protein